MSADPGIHMFAWRRTPLRSLSELDVSSTGMGGGNCSCTPLTAEDASTASLAGVCDT